MRLLVVACWPRLHLNYLQYAHAWLRRSSLPSCHAGADRQRKRLLKTVPIVGVTCCSSLLAVLDGQQFDVVILDESSQMVEPLSAVPLLRARARCAKGRR